MTPQISSNDLTTLDRALSELRNVEGAIQSLQDRRELLRDTIAQITLGLALQNNGQSPVPGVTLVDKTDYELDELKVKEFVLHPDNLAACTQAINVKGDAIPLLVGMSLQHPEFNLQRAFSLNILGYKAMIRQGKLGGLPVEKVLPETGIAVKVKDFKYNSALAELFTVNPSSEPLSDLPEIAPF